MDPSSVRFGSKTIALPLSVVKSSVVPVIFCVVLNLKVSALIVAREVCQGSIVHRAL